MGNNSEDKSILLANSKLHSAAERDPGDTSPPRGNPFPIVGVGASAGGLEAFRQLLAGVPANTGMAFVLIQHLDPHHDSQLAGILQPLTGMKVQTVTDGMRIRPNRVYLIPPNATMVLNEATFAVAVRDPGLHLPIDIFFRSLASVQGSRAIGIVLSGNASDGSEGLKAIKAECGITFAQDEATAAFSGMPHNAARTGVVDFVLPPAEIASELARISSHPFLQPPQPDRADLELLPDGNAELRKLFSLLHEATKVDFALYKRTTVRRRVGRRMMVHQTPTLEDYVKYLQQHPAELRELYRDLLITVTGFFRDPGMFEAVAKLIRDRLQSPDASRPEELRVWAAGCATGEEVYSLAICVHEVIKDLKYPLRLQLFGTDINELAIDRARAGLYGDTISRDISPERLDRFFEKTDNGYQVCKTIRECCIFARQDITKDPPFSRIDLISCRNVMIYMTTPLQRRVFPIFHYSLKPDGMLMLGSAESTAVADDLFGVLDKQNHIYRRRPAPLRLDLDLAPGRYSTLDTTSELPLAANPTPKEDLQKKVERVLQTRYSPASVVVDSHLNILQFRGHTKPYLDPSPGEASLNVLQLAQRSLLRPIRKGIEAAREKTTTVRESAFYTQGDDKVRVALEITPITGASPGENYFLIVFQPDNPAAVRVPPTDDTAPSGEPYERISQLEIELADTRDYLRNLSEDHEVYAEELRAANEEIRSSNEELLSVNEELGTTKEELQSSNEELTTVNEELQHRNDELSSINNDFRNLLIAVDIPILMVDPNLRVRRFTLAAEKLLDLNPMDIGRPIGQVGPKMKVVDVERLVRSVMDSLNVQSDEVQNADGQWFSMTIRPYRTIDNRIDGAVITFMDVDPLKQAVKVAEQARDYAEGMIETVREPLVVLDADLRVQRATAAFYDRFQVNRQETTGRFFYDLGNGQWNQPRLRELIGNALFRDEAFADFEIEHELPYIGRRNMRLNGRRIPVPEEHARIVLVAIEDVTERREEAELRYRRLFETAKDGMLVMDPETGAITDVNPFFSELSGYPRELLVGKKAAAVGAFADGFDGSTLITGAMEAGMVRYFESPLMTRSGKKVWVDVVANRYEMGSRTVVQANFRDVGERRNAESALKASEERFRRFVESVSDYALFQMDPEGCIVTWNSGAERVLGYSEREIIGKHIRVLFTPEDIASGEPEKELARACESGSDDERWHVRKNGSRFYASGVVTRIDDEAGSLRGLAKVMRDVTDRKAAEEQLRRSLHEKEVLLREVHHRVKNNLQVITSLLNLQAEHPKHPETVAVLEEMRNRVHSLAGIHELLYSASNLSRINFDKFLSRLAQDLAAFYSAEVHAIRIQVEARAFNLDIGQAVPCALIVNELVMNSMKHAFPDGRSGTIIIRATEEGNEHLLEVCDDGIGLPADRDPATATTMGLQLVSLLSDQLHANLSLDRREGSRFSIRFPRRL